MTSKNVLELICGMFLSALCAGFLGFILLILYDHWSPRIEMAKEDESRKGSAFVKVLCVAIAIGVLGFIAHFCSEHGYGW